VAEPIMARDGWDGLSNTPSHPALIALNDMTAGEFARGGWRTIIEKDSAPTADRSPRRAEAPLLPRNVQ
jgi:hypothetical protein